MKYVDKKYIYLRENKKCFHCGKALDTLGKVTLDHYYPRSHGGTYDLFNLVSCCKKCNKYKKSNIPDDYKDVHMRLFIKSVEDKRIVYFSTIGLKHSEIFELAREIYEVENHDDYTIFKSKRYKFYVSQNKIIKLEKIY